MERVNVAKVDLKRNDITVICLANKRIKNDYIIFVPGTLTL